MYLDSMNLPSRQKKKKKKKKKVTENRGSENIWLKIRARPKLTTRIFGHLWPVTSREQWYGAYQVCTMILSKSELLNSIK